MKLVAISMNRSNGGIRAKRRYGSSTLTTFMVMRPEDRDNPTRWVEIKDVGGRTPGERATTAKTDAEPMIPGFRRYRDLNSQR